MGGRRRATTRLALPATACLALGACAGVCGLFMPWIAIEAGVLNLLGIVPSEAVHGYRIPALVRDSGGHPVLQGGAATAELFQGRLDLAAARLLFGERYEKDWAPIVVLPAIFSLVCLPVLFHLHRIRPLNRLLAAVAVLIFAGTSAAAMRLSGEAAAGSLLSPSLVVHDGIWVTTVATAFTAAGAMLSLKRPRARRRPARLNRRQRMDR